MEEHLLHRKARFGTQNRGKIVLKNFQGKRGRQDGGSFLGDEASR